MTRIGSAYRLAAGLIAMHAADQQASAQSRVAGGVVDSLRGTPLTSAVVQFTVLGGADAGRTFVSRTDSAGRYRIDSLPAGRYLAGFMHARLDSLGIDERSREVSLVDGANDVGFATPDERTMLSGVCRMPETDLTTRRMIVGHVRRSSDGSPLGHASVQVWWREPFDSIAGFFRDRSAKVSTREDGWFALCGVARVVSILGQAAHATDTSGVVPLSSTTSAVDYVAFTLGAGFRQPTDDSSAVVSALWRGKSRITGTALDENRRPLAGVEVSIAGTGVSVRTDPNGRFSADSLPAGTQLLQSRGVGYEPVQLVVNLADEGSTDVELPLLRRAISLDRVEVRASREDAALERLQYRRFRGTTSGYYMLPEEIRRRPQEQSMARLIEGLPGVMVQCPYPHSCTVAMYRPSSHVSRSGRELCVPSLYIDGRLDRSADFNFLDAKHILAFEVYPREAGRPVEFFDLHNNCGAVVFWTRRP